MACPIIPFQKKKRRRVWEVPRWHVPSPVSRFNRIPFVTLWPARLCFIGKQCTSITRPNAIFSSRQIQQKKWNKTKKMGDIINSKNDEHTVHCARKSRKTHDHCRPPHCSNNFVSKNYCALGCFLMNFAPPSVESDCHIWLGVYLGGQKIARLT